MLAFLLLSPIAALGSGIGSILLSRQVLRRALARRLSVFSLAGGLIGGALLLRFAWYNYELFSSGHEIDYVFSTRAMARDALVWGLTAVLGAMLCAVGFHRTSRG
jgi:hypothetical protein